MNARPMIWLLRTEPHVRESSESERLSLPTLVRDLRAHGQSARAAESIDDIIGTIVTRHRPGDLVVIMSNGGFGGIHQKLVRALGVEANKA